MILGFSKPNIVFGSFDHFYQFWKNIKISHKILINKHSIRVSYKDLSLNNPKLIIELQVKTNQW